MDDWGKEKKMGHEKRRNNDTRIILAIMGSAKKFVPVMWC